MKSINIPHMIQIGSTGRNSGKTMLAKEIIKNYHQNIPIYGLKIITISGAKGKCQRGEVGCGICTSIESGFELIEETNVFGEKDTMQLLKAGCERVFLLKVFYDFLLEGIQNFLGCVPSEALIVCESNSLREVAKPGFFVMMNNQRRVKPTAAKVINEADIILEKPILTELDDFIKNMMHINYLSKK